MQANRQTFGRQNLDPCGGYYGIQVSIIAVLPYTAKFEIDPCFDLFTKGFAKRQPRLAFIVSCISIAAERKRKRTRPDRACKMKWLVRRVRKHTMDFQPEDAYRVVSRNARAAGFDHPVASFVRAAPDSAREMDLASDGLNAPEEGMLNNKISITLKQSANFTESNFDFQ